MIKKMKAAALIYIFSTILTANSYATTSSSNLAANATLAGACQLSISDFNFGTITPGTFPNITNNLDILCSKDIAFVVKMNFSTPNSYMIGKEHGDFLYFVLFAMNTGNIISPSSPTMMSVPNSTGTKASYPIMAVITDSDFKSMATPYVTPDNYSTSIQVVIQY